MKQVKKKTVIKFTSAVIALFAVCVGSYYFFKNDKKKELTLHFKISRLPASVDSQNLASQVNTIFKANCYSCHGDEGQKIRGDLNLRDAKSLRSKKMIDIDFPEKSQLYKSITGTSPEMPAGRGSRPLNIDEQNIILAWIKDGAAEYIDPALANKNLNKKLILRPKPQIVAASNSNGIDIQIHKIIFDYLQLISKPQAEKTRFITLTNLYTYKSREEMNTYIMAITKAINSLSLSPNIITPIALDEEETVFAINLDDLGPNAVKAWANLESRYPYFPLFQTTAYDFAKSITRTDLPYLRGDWFIYNAFIEPNYSRFLGLPASTSALEQQLGVDAASNYTKGKVARMSFSNSGVSSFNRVIERHDITKYNGYYWKSFDFNSNVETSNIFTHPISKAENSQKGFVHAGGELIFSLQNGFQGYFLVDAKGNQIDKGPNDVVQDPLRRDSTVVNAISCISCHKEGIKEKPDQIFPIFSKQPKAYNDIQNQIKLTYKGAAEDAKIFSADQAKFTAALASINISSSERSEPIIKVYKTYEDVVTLERAAEEIGITTSELLSIEDETVQPIILRMEIAGIARDIFESNYSFILEKLAEKKKITFKDIKPVLNREFKVVKSGNTFFIEVSKNQLKGRICDDGLIGPPADGNAEKMIINILRLENKNCKLVTATGSSFMVINLLSCSAKAENLSQCTFNTPASACRADENVAVTCGGIDLNRIAE
jgi:cytochrome c553